MIDIDEIDAEESTDMNKDVVAGLTGSEVETVSRLLDSTDEGVTDDNGDMDDSEVTRDSDLGTLVELETALTRDGGLVVMDRVDVELLEAEIMSELMLVTDNDVTEGERGIVFGTAVVLDEDEVFDKPGQAEDGIVVNAISMQSGDRPLK